MIISRTKIPTTNEEVESVNHNDRPTLSDQHPINKNSRQKGKQYSYDPTDGTVTEEFY